MKRATVRVTRHFARNLDGIEAFLREADAAAAFAPHCAAIVRRPPCGEKSWSVAGRQVLCT